MNTVLVEDDSFRFSSLIIVFYLKSVDAVIALFDFLVLALFLNRKVELCDSLRDDADVDLLGQIEVIPVYKRLLRFFCVHLPIQKVLIEFSFDILLASFPFQAIIFQE